MPTSLPKKYPGGFRRPSAGVISDRALIGATLFVALVFSVVTGVLPALLVLPAMSVIVVLSGLALGGWALSMRRLRGTPNESMLDIAGIFVLFGFATAIICDKTEALRLLAALPGV